MLSTGVYNATAVIYSDGAVEPLAIDTNANLKVTLASTIAGEDITNDVLKVEQRYSYASGTAVNALIKSGAGFLHNVTFGAGTTVMTTGSCVIYDNTAASGTQIFFHFFGTAQVVQPVTIPLDVTFATGLQIAFTGNNHVTYTVAYR